MHPHQLNFSFLGSIQGCQARRGARFQEIISTAKSPVVLLEGSRNVPVAVALKMESPAAHLMNQFRALIARSGNAEGSDEAYLNLRANGNDRNV